MIALRTALALSAAAFVSACASPDMPGTTATNADQHTAHHPDAATSAPTAAMQDRMKAMHAMHDKMAQAKTPEERQALMADHMKAMQGGMQTMKGMGGMGVMGGAACMRDPQGRPADLGKCQQLMDQRMDMMQMMLDMMMQRMPAMPPAGK
jgi:hypothetical protein